MEENDIYFIKQSKHASLNTLSLATKIISQIYRIWSFITLISEPLIRFMNQQLWPRSRESQLCLTWMKLFHDDVKQNDADNFFLAQTHTNLFLL